MKIEDRFYFRTRPDGKLSIPYLWEMKKDGLYIICSDYTMANISRWCHVKGLSREDFNVQEYLAEGNPYDFSWGNATFDDGFIHMVDADSETARVTGTILFNYMRSYNRERNYTPVKIRVVVPLVFKDRLLEDRYRSMLRFSINVGSLDFKKERDETRYYNWVESHLHPLPF